MPPERPGMEDMAEELTEMPLLTGRIMRVLLALSNGELVADLLHGSGTDSEPGSACLERLRFSGRIPGLTVIAAALARATGWHPVPGQQPGSVDLVDARRRCRLRIRTDAERSRLDVEVCAVGKTQPPVVGRRPDPGRIRLASPRGDVFAWLEMLRKRCRTVAQGEGIEILECSRQGAAPLRMALHTVAEEERSRGNPFRNRTMPGTRRN